MKIVRLTPALWMVGNPLSGMLEERVIQRDALKRTDSPPAESAGLQYETASG
jgi:hypothetical protein